MITVHDAKRLIYRLKHEYGTLNNIVLAVALLIAAGWVWGAVSMMQRNYSLQQEYDAKMRQLELTDLEVKTLEYQQRYYESDEYKELAAREDLGLAVKGEKVLILPPNSEKAKQMDAPKSVAVSSTTARSNFRQWMDFLLGGAAQHLQS